MQSSRWYSRLILLRLALGIILLLASFHIASALAKSHKVTPKMKLSPIAAVFVFGASIALGFAAIVLKVSPTVPTAVVCAIPLVCTACYWCSKKGKNPIGEETPLASSLSDSVEALGNYSKQILATEPAVKVREDYFDNLKVFLTVVVVMHHTVCAFVGTSWFYTIGDFDGNSFKSFGFATLLLNQSYYVFIFFISILHSTLI